jgi:hypothetical protein
MRHRSIFPFMFSSIILVMSIQQLPFAQLPIYNSDFKLSRSIRSKGDFGDSLRLMGIVDRTYEIQGSKVIEYYEMNTARFLGFAGDTMQFNLRKLPYLSRTPTMRRLVKQFGPATAHDIRQGKFVPGILQKDILEMYSWPKKRKREGKKTLWIYETVVLEFEKGVLTQFTRQGS